MMNKLLEYLQQGNYGGTKVLVEFITFLTNNGYELSESAEKIEEFKEGDYFRTKSKETQKNYLRRIRRFVEYVYESEGYTQYPSRTKQNETIETEPRKRGGEDNEEYNEFIRRYEELTR